MRHKNFDVWKCAFALAVVTVALAVGASGCATIASSSGIANAANSVQKKSSHTTPGSVIACSGTNCSLFLTRAQTRQFNNNVNLAGGGTVGLGVSCSLFTLMSGPAGVIVAVACGAGIAIYGGLLLNAVSRAAGDNACLRVQFRAIRVHVPLTHITKYVPISPGLAFNDDQSSNCH